MSPTGPERDRPGGAARQEIQRAGDEIPAGLRSLGYEVVLINDDMFDNFKIRFKLKVPWA